MADHRSYQEIARERNLSLILKALHAESPATRPDLARKTGINRTTVSSLVEELVDYDLVREVGYESSGLGRRSLLLELNPSMGFVVAAEQGADFVSVICSDFTPKILWECQESISDTLTEEEIIGFCRKKLAAYKSPKTVEFRKELPKSAVGKILRKVLRDEEAAKKE